MNQFDPREVMGAAADSIAMKMGLTRNFPHPLAAMLSMRDISTAAATVKRPALAHEVDMAVFARGLGTPDFQTLMSDAIAAVSVTGYETQGEHLRFCLPVSVKDFKPTSIPVMDADVNLEPLAEGGEVQWNSALTVGGEQLVQIATYAKIIAITRQTIVNDNLGAIAQAVRQIGAGVSRMEARMVAAAMEANGNLNDGQPVFHADFMNVVTDAMGGGLSFAIGSLRKQLGSSGQRVDLKAKHLVVEPDLEITAKSIVTDLGLTDITVSVLADLPAGRYYVLADQQIAPTVSVLRLGAAKNPLRAKFAGRDTNIDGLGVRITADIGTCILRRQGIVRGGA